MKLSMTKLMPNLTVLVVLSSLMATAAHADAAFSLGASFNSGGSPYYQQPYYQQPIFAGAAAANFGNIAGCVQSPAFYGVGQIGPSFQGGFAQQAPYLPSVSLPPIVPQLTAPTAPPLLNPGIMVPPAVAYQQSLAAQVQFAQPASCVPCSLARPAVVGPVLGGPVLEGYGNAGFASSGNVNINVGGRNAWEIDDSADIIWATASGMAGQASSVYPMAFPQQRLNTSVGFYNTGDRDYTLIPRVHSGN